MSLERSFSGLDRLYGRAAAAQIRAAHVVIVGLGGVGSWAAEALARSGLERLTLIDLDHVAQSNINRQVHALTETVGQAKVLAMRDRIAHINDRCVVSCVDEFVTAQNWPELLEGRADSLVASSPALAVIDACDDVAAKVSMAVWARQTDCHFVSVGAAGGKKLAHLVDVDDLASVTHDPLLAQVRHRLRRQHGAPREGKRMKVACVFSREAVAPPDASCAVEGDGSLNCHGYGSIVSVTATFGQCAAGWVMNSIANRSNTFSAVGKITL